MNEFQQILDMISRFISETFLWPVAVLVIVIIFKKVIEEKITNLSSFETAFGKFNFNKGVKFAENLITKKEKSQSNQKTAANFNESTNPEIAIPRIYSTIESAVMKKFDVKDSYNMLVSLAENKKIDTETFIILDSMRFLRENIHTGTRKITQKNIDAYENNAKRIIEIIQSIEN